MTNRNKPKLRPQLLLLPPGLQKYAFNYTAVLTWRTNRRLVYRTKVKVCIPVQRGIILSDNYRLPLSVSSFISLP